MDAGKDFEQQFKKSIPPSFYYYRLKDDMSGFKSINNPCDYFIFNTPHLHLFELKTHKGKSIPFTALTQGQIMGMYEAKKFNGIKAGFVFNFRDIAETYYVDINDFMEYYNTTSRKSVSLDFCKEKGLVVEQQKIRVKYKFNIEKLMEDIVNGY